MKKKDRLNQLIKTLTVKNQFVTARELSGELGISEKTIYRMVRELNEIYFPEVLIVSEKGKGYCLNEHLKNDSINFIENEYMSAEKRRENILERLLMISPNSISTIVLGQEFYVSEAQILKDKQLLQRQIAPYHLEILSRKGELLIRGHEFDIRQAIADLIPSFSTIDLDRLGMINDTSIESTLAQFLQDELKKVERNLNAQIPYPYNVNIFSHLYIMVHRILKSRILKHLPNEENSAIEIDEKDLYEESCRVIAAIETYIYREIPTVEIEYLYRYLVSSRFQSQKFVSGSPKFSKRVHTITTRFFEEFTLLNLSNVKEDSPLFVDLANHINPLLRRMDNKIRIKNNMLCDIKENYKAIFDELVRISKMISQNYGLSSINADEIGFLTLYFARFKEIQRKRVKVVIMCTTGIGTSELLKSKIENNFSDLEILGVTNYQKPEELINHFPSLELLISTVDYPETKVYKSIVVSALLSEDDKNRIRNYIRDISYEK
ncbi:BglG family transcription antiterminator [Streptococcus pluranimalium]|uniref:BglG family transcription antiterminator n=1 Tax=Streptococcus pluranimalium TaxID=82348 RepID=UPI003F692454